MEAVLVVCLVSEPCSDLRSRLSGPLFATLWPGKQFVAVLDGVSGQASTVSRCCEGVATAGRRG